MNTKDIAEVLLLLEERKPVWLGDLDRQRNEALTLLGWYEQIVQLDTNQADEAVKARILAVVNSADRAISKLMAKPRG